MATRVAEAHPKQATIGRSLSQRPAGAVYVDYLQNALGKTMASVYCVRARPGATVSTPLRWDELAPDLDPRAFTMKTVPQRIREAGDLWAEAMAQRNSLKDLFKRQK